MQGGSQSLEVVIIAVVTGKSCWVESECVPTPRHPSRTLLGAQLETVTPGMALVNLQTDGTALEVACSRLREQENGWFMTLATGTRLMAIPRPPNRLARGDGAQRSRLGIVDGACALVIVQVRQGRVAAMQPPVGKAVQLSLAHAAGPSAQRQQQEHALAEHR